MDLKLQNDINWLYIIDIYLLKLLYYNQRPVLLYCAISSDIMNLSTYFISKTLFSKIIIVFVDL